MNKLSITLAAWNAWEQSSTPPNSWTETTERSEMIHPGLPKAERIPPMLRRRLGNLGKPAITSAEGLIGPLTDSIPTVFCSQHGDLNRTLDLLESIALSEPLSPTHFSLSVHNAIAGIYSIARNDRSPTTAISCAIDDASTALLETQMILEEQKSQYALCVVHDEPLPESYEKSHGPHQAYAASFLLTSSSNLNTRSLELSLSQKPYDDGVENSIERPSALALVDFLNRDSQPKLSLSPENKVWTWQKNNQEVCS